MPQIRVKSFAKIDETANDFNANNNGLDTMDVDIIELSSDDEIEDKKPVIKKGRNRSGGKKRSKNIAETPKLKNEPKPRPPPSTGLSRRFRTPLQNKYHKISDFFSSTKKDCKLIYYVHWLMGLSIKNIQTFNQYFIF